MILTWVLCRGCLLGLALFGAISHALLLMGSAVPAAWFVTSLFLGIALAVLTNRRLRAQDGVAAPSRWIPWALLLAIAVLLLVAFFLALGPLATEGGVVTANALDLIAHGWSPEAANGLVDDALPLLDWGLRGIFGIMCIGIVIEIAKGSFKLVKRLAG